MVIILASNIKQSIDYVFNCKLYFNKKNIDFNKTINRFFYSANTIISSFCCSHFPTTDVAKAFPKTLVALRNISQK